MACGFRLAFLAAAVIGALFALAPAALAQPGPSPFTSVTRFDALGRVTGTIAPDPDGDGANFLATRNSYDPSGNLVKAEEGVLAAWQGEAAAPAQWAGFIVHRSVESTYDSLGRKTSEKLSGAPSTGGAMAVQTLTQLSYDPVGRLECTAQRMNPAAFGSLPDSACVPGPEGSFGPDRIVRNAYDPRGQLIRVTEALGTADQADERSLTYSLNGRLATLTDAENNRTSFEYDGHDRLEKTLFPATAKGAGTSSGADPEQYGYDASGNRTSLRKRDGRMLYFSFDALDRTTAKDVPGTAADIAYGYDLRGLPLSATFTASGEAVTSDYDNAGRLASSTSTMGGASLTLSSLHDANGGRTRLSWPDGAAVSFDRDGMGRLTTFEKGSRSAIATSCSCATPTRIPAGLMRCFAATARAARAAPIMGDHVRLRRREPADLRLGRQERDPRLRPARAALLDRERRQRHPVPPRRRRSGGGI